MSASPEIALLVSSFERPRHLQRTLLSIALQKDAGKFEVVVTDDGSRDETAEIVKRFAANAYFPVRLTTHEHDGFQLARCRNEGVRASSAPYLLFLDGDCVLPPDHVALHLQHRKHGVTIAGDCCRLDEQDSQRVTEAAIRDGRFVDWAPGTERRRMARQHRRARFYNLIRHRTKPKLIGNNIGIWRSDYERVNGYDEQFVGWGCEDDDLRLRLKQAGVRIESIMKWTCTYHLWHPPVPSAPQSWRAGANVDRLRRKVRFTRCRKGLRTLDEDDLNVRVIGQPDDPHAAAGILPISLWKEPRVDAAEVELLMLPGQGRFSGDAECNVLVVLGDSPDVRHAVRQADVVVSDCQLANLDKRPHLPISELSEALRSVA